MNDGHKYSNDSSIPQNDRLQTWCPIAAWGYLPSLWENPFGPSSLFCIICLEHMLFSYTERFQQSPGDLSLLPGKFGKAASLAKFITAEEEGTSCKLEGGCWMSLQQYRAHNLPTPGRFPGVFHPKNCGRSYFVCHLG